MQTKRGDCVVVLDGKYAGKVGFVNTVLDHDGDWDGTGKITWKKGDLTLDMKDGDKPVLIIIPANKVSRLTNREKQIVENDRKTLDRLANLRQYLEQSRDHVSTPIGIGDFEFLLGLAERAAI